MVTDVLTNNVYKEYPMFPVKLSSFLYIKYKALDKLEVNGIDTLFTEPFTSYSGTTDSQKSL